MNGNSLEGRSLHSKGSATIYVSLTNHGHMLGKLFCRSKLCPHGYTSSVFKHSYQLSTIRFTYQHKPNFSLLLQTNNKSMYAALFLRDVTEISLQWLGA